MKQQAYYSNQRNSDSHQSNSRPKRVIHSGPGHCLSQACFYTPGNEKGASPLTSKSFKKWTFPSRSFFFFFIFTVFFSWCCIIYLIIYIHLKRPGINFCYSPIKLSCATLKAIYTLLMRGTISKIQSTQVISEMHTRRYAGMWGFLPWSPVFAIFPVSKGNKWSVTSSISWACVPTSDIMVFQYVFPHDMFPFPIISIWIMRTQETGEHFMWLSQGPRASSWKSSLKMCCCCHCHLSPEAFRGATCLPVGGMRIFFTFDARRPAWV